VKLIERGTSVCIGGTWTDIESKYDEKERDYGEHQEFVGIKKIIIKGNKGDILRIAVENF